MRTNITSVEFVLNFFCTSVSEFYLTPASPQFVHNFYGDLSLSTHVCRGEREKGQRRGVGRKRGGLVSSAVSELETRVSSFSLLAVLSSVYHYTNT